jgi:hypothetical protein
MRLYMMCSAAAVILAASSAMADPASTPAATPGPAVTSPAASEADNDPIVCHTEEVTGSRLGTSRSCARQSVWDRRREHDRQQMEEIQNRGNATSGGG